jgi:hypothetical protein
LSQQVVAVNSAVSEKEEQTVSTVSVSTMNAGGTSVSVRTVQVSRWALTFHHKNLARSIGAIASLAGAMSVLVGVLATHMSPHGWGHVKMALHLTKKPLLMQLAPFIAAFAVTAATVAGLMSFYSWYREGREKKAAASRPSDPIS